MAIELSGGLRVVWNWGSLLSNDLAPRIIDVSTEETVCQLNGHTDMIRGGKELSDGRLITWSNDQTLRIWQVRTGECQAVLAGHKEYIDQVLELPEGLLVSFSNDQTFRVWELSTGNLQHTIDISLWVNGLMTRNAEQRSLAGDNVSVRPDVETMIKRKSHLVVVWEKYTGNVGIWDLTSGNLIRECSHPSRFATDYCLGQLFDLPDDFFASHDWSDQTLNVWCARTGKRQASFEGRWDGLLGFHEGSKRLKLFGYSHRFRHIECSLVDLAAPGANKQISIPGARVAQARVWQDGFAIWTEDFRLILFDRSLELLKVVPVPPLSQGDVKIIDPYRTELSDDALLDYIEHADNGNARFFSPGESGSGFMQAHYFASPGSYDIRYYKTESRHSDSLIAWFTGWPCSGKDNLFDYTNDTQGNLIAGSSGGHFSRVDFHEPGSEAPFAVRDLSNTVGDAEFWDHVYRAPRIVLLQGGYVPDNSLSHLLPVSGTDSLGTTDEAQWHLLHDRKKRLRVTTKGDLLSWHVQDRTSLSLIPREGQTLAKPVPLVDSADTRDGHCSLLIAPDGALHFWYGGGKPELLNNPCNGQAVCVNPDTRRYYSTHFWAENNQITIADNRQLTILNAESGKIIRTLPVPFDGHVYGVALVDGKRWIAWSRAELASWCAYSFKPLYRLHDPGEWGPGCENVVPLKAGGIAYCSGCWSGDNRIVIWDGGEATATVLCHDQEVVALTELADGSIMSFSEADGGSCTRWKIS